MWIDNAINASIVEGITEVIGWFVAKDFDRGKY